MGTVIGIFSPKGGVGKTLLATNLAVAIGLGHHRETILVDLNNGSGSADLLLDLSPDRSWADLVPVLRELTPQHLSLTVTAYRPGVDLLACPSELITPEALTQENLSFLLGTLRKTYDLTIVDTPAGAGVTEGALLDLADICLLLLTPDLPSLRSISRLLAILPSQEGRFGVIVNQCSPGAAINPNEIKQHLGEPVWGVLPIDPLGAWTNISYGEPCVLRKSSTLGRSIRQLSTHLLRMVDQMSDQKPKFNESKR
jgi:pilus assembly protein CpaE